LATPCAHSSSRHRSKTAASGKAAGNSPTPSGAATATAVRGSCSIQGKQDNRDNNGCWNE
jgi:hypothetical protein